MLCTKAMFVHRRLSVMRHTCSAQCAVHSSPRAEVINSFGWRETKSRTLERDDFVSFGIFTNLLFYTLNLLLMPDSNKKVRIYKNYAKTFTYPSHISSRLYFS